MERSYLKNLRKEKKMTQSDMGINQSYFAMIERGERCKDMGIGTAALFAKKLNVPLYDFIHMELEYQRSAK